MVLHLKYQSKLSEHIPQYVFNHTTLYMLHLCFVTTNILTFVSFIYIRTVVVNTTQKYLHFIFYLKIMNPYTDKCLAVFLV